MDNEQSHKLEDPLRELPSVDRVLRQLSHLDVPIEVLAAEVRLAINETRGEIRAGKNGVSVSIEEQVERKLARLAQPSLRRVINATGVVLHTNLGRAPIEHLPVTKGYSNLEYDLATGKRGKRDQHTSDLLASLLGYSAIVVNNNAAAVFLVLNEHAAGREVIVSRGELIEIGDGFRIPDIMARSGAILREVGTTNRTRITDYEQAITDRTALILRVHPSNFHVSGFTSRPELQDLSALAKTRNIPLYEDLGSGCIADLRPFGVNEPLVGNSLKAGASLVSFSGDKLLGGPQCGIIAGDDNLVTRIRRNPLYRAFRVDKLIIQALETTLRHLLFRNWEALPALRMIMTPESALQARAERVAGGIRRAQPVVRPDRSPIGGGSTPDQALPTWVIELSSGNASQLERRFRSMAVPVIARIENDRVILDMRTISDDEEADLIEAVNASMS